MTTVVNSFKKNEIMR